MNLSSGRPKIPNILKKRSRFCEYCSKSQEYIAFEANFHINLANCGHIICSRCATEYDGICITCKKKVRFERIHDDMPYEIKRHVLPVSELVDEIVTIAQFQLQQSESFLKIMQDRMPTMKDEIRHAVEAARAIKKKYLTLVEIVKKDKVVVNERMKLMKLNRSLDNTSGYSSNRSLNISNQKTPTISAGTEQLKPKEQHSKSGLSMR